MAQTISQRPAKASAPQRVPASGPAPKRDPAPHISAEAIAKRAYQKFVARGGADGHDQADWFGAEQELIAEARKK